MAGSQISTSITIIDSLSGFMALSLTEYATSAAAAIAAGSKVEIAGAFFTFAGDEPIEASTWTSIVTGNTAYITLTATGTAGSQIVVAAYTSTAPTWRDDLQGWYASAASNVRVIGSVYKAEAANYARKYVLDQTQQDYSRNYRWRGEKELITTGASTWAVPAGVYKIRVTCIGGGGGGGEGGVAGSNGSSGGSTLFDGATTGLGGLGGQGVGTGNGSGGAGPTGGAGCAGTHGNTGSAIIGGIGGGAGGLGTPAAGAAGNPGGYGGGGGGCGTGGGGGGTNISMVLGTTIYVMPGAIKSYSVGAGGAGGAGSAGPDGGAGGSGIIIIEY